MVESESRWRVLYVLPTQLGDIGRSEQAERVQGPRGLFDPNGVPIHVRLISNCSEAEAKGMNGAWRPVAKTQKFPEPETSSR